MDIKFENPPDKFAAVFVMPDNTTAVDIWINDKDGIYRISAQPKDTENDK